MARDEFWIKKIKGFLLTPQDESVYLSKGEELAKDLTAAALGPIADNIDLSELAEAKKLAEGLDIPRFIKQFSPDAFRENPIFKHPLSGEEIRFDLGNGTIDTGKTNQLIKAAISQIRKEVEEAPFDYQKLYLSLWRNLPDVIRQIENKESEFSTFNIGKYWDWLPADPRIPTHSVWEHSSIVSAVAGANSKPALLLFTIASPQQFISSARRTQDSWMGSFLLSFLMWEAVKHIAEQYGPDCFLFPDLRRQPLVDRWLEKQIGISIFNKHEESVFQIANFPNVLTAILPETEAAKIAETAKREMTEKWKEVAWHVRERVEKAITDHLDINPGAGWGQIWERQIEDFLPQQGVFWAVCPWQDGDKSAIEVYEQLLPENTSQRNLKDLTETVAAQGGEINPGMMYQAISTIASRALTARKNLRDFQNKREEGERCTLCGVREAVHPEFDEIKTKLKNSGEKLKPTEYNLLRYFWRNLSEVEFKSFGKRIKFKGRIKRGDFLCAVCLVKRLALEHYFDEEHNNGFDFKNYHLFPSTSSISTAPFKAKVIENLSDEKVKTALAEYNQNVGEFLDKVGLVRESSAVPKLEKEINGENRDLIETFLRIDGQWLFKESFRSQEVEAEIKSKPSADDARKKAVVSLEKLLKLFDEKPSNYYAVIAMDGDKIGDWIKGTKAPPFISLFHPFIADKLKDDSIFYERRPLGAISHLSLSIALKNFALEVAPQIVEQQHYGKLIYAGGDDLIAFVPTKDLLKLIKQLRMLFQGEEIRLNGFDARSGVICVAKGTEKERDFLAAGAARDKDSVRPTVSIGAAIIHNSYPLPQAIEEAFTSAMKAHAKEKLGRDAVAIHLNKRAGHPLEVGFKWHTAEQSPDMAELLQKTVGYFKDGSLSSRICYAMNRREIGLEGNWSDERDAGKVHWWHDAQNQVLRHLVKRHSTKEKWAEIQTTLQLLLAVIYRIYQDLSERPDTGFRTLTKMLLLARFLAGEEN